MERLAPLVLSFQQSFPRTALFPEASASPCRQYKTSSLWPSLLTDAISHTGSETTRFQSHHCCEGNCSSLSHKSAPPCAPQAKTYIYTQTGAHTSTDRKRQTHTRIPSPLCQNQKTLLLNLSLSCFLYPSHCVVGCWIYTDRIHLMSSMFPGLTVFIWALRAHHASYPHVLDWMETCPWTIWEILV